MTRRHRPAQRDASEPAIVAALVAAGATVTKLKGDGETHAPGLTKPIHGGEPDLLVVFAGRIVLMEVKLPLGPRGGKGSGGASRPVNGGDGVLSAAQLAWHAATDCVAVVVRTPAEALAAIGATSKEEG